MKGCFPVGASATTRIKRGDFGLTRNAALETGGFLVGNNLKIELEVSDLGIGGERLGDRELVAAARVTIETP